MKPCLNVRITRWSVLVVAAGLALAPLIAAAAPGSGELNWRSSDGALHSLASLDTQVDISVHGLVAEVEVRQRFRNTSANWLEAEYVLPLPDGAAVHAMTLHVGKRLIVAQIKARQAARKAFVHARATGRKAALVEAGGNHLFRTAATNIAPGETVAIELHYWQRVDYRNQRFSLRFPLTYTPRYHMHKDGMDNGMQPAPADPEFTGSDAPMLKTSISVSLDAGVPLASVTSPSHTIIAVRQGELWQVGLRKEAVTPNRDFVLMWQPKPSTMPVIASFTQLSDGQDYAMLMVLPPQQSVRELPRELILVIDTSGSMGGRSIRQARKAIEAALATLKPGDRFNVIEFNSSMRAWRPHAVPASSALVAQAHAWVADLHAGGGTEMAPALTFALAGHAPPGYVRQVVFATDGAIANPGGLLALIDAHLGDSRLFPVGIGSAPNAGFMHAAAKHGRGTSLVISDLSQVASTIGRLTALLTHPAVTGISIDWPQGTVAYPKRIPDLYLGEPLLVTARLPHPVMQVQINGQFADHAWTVPIAVDNDAHAVGLARLWAQARIDDLEGQLARGGSLDLLRPEIVKAALGASLVSRFTSLVAVDQTPAREDAPLDHTRIPNAMPAGTHFASTATGSRLLALLALLALLLATACAWRARSGECA